VEKLENSINFLQSLPVQPGVAGPVIRRSKHANLSFFAPGAPGIQPSEKSSIGKSGDFLAGETQTQHIITNQEVVTT
jgi:hypothetical protein